MPVKVLKTLVDAEEFANWIAFDRVCPWGQDWNDFLTGIIASTIANCHRSPNQDRFTPADFMWKYKPDATDEEQTDEEIEQEIRLAIKAPKPEPKP